MKIIEAILIFLKRHAIAVVANDVRNFGEYNGVYKR
jgi:hypothetical protein